MDQSAEKAASSSSESIQKNSISSVHDISAQLGEKKTDNTEDENHYVTGIPLYTIVGGLTMAAFLLMLDTTVVSTSIPKISDEFNSLKDVGWYGSAYTLTVCSLQLLFGKIYQVYNKKYSFMAAMALFEVGSLISATATSSRMFIVGRAIAGCGGSGIYGGALTIIATSAPMSARPALLGIAVGFSAIGLAVGPLVGGALTEHTTWRWCFYINIPLGALTILALSFIRIPNARAQPTTKLSVKTQIKRLDLLGCAFFILSTVMLLLALNWGGSTYHWSSSKVIGLFVGSGINFLVFLGWEHYCGKDAMLPLDLVSQSIVACAAATNFFPTGGFFLVSYYLPVWFQVVKGVSPLSSGVHTLPSIISQVFTTLATGFLISKFGYYTPFGISGCVIGAIGAGLLTTLNPTSTAAAWICFQLLMGISRGMLNQVPITAVQASLPPETMPVGTALVTTCMSLGAAIFVSLGQTTLINVLKPALAKHAPTVDVEEVVSVGATAFKTAVSLDEVNNVIKAYNQAITTIFYLAAAACAVGFFTAWGLGWKNLKEKKAKLEGEA